MQIGILALQGAFIEHSQVLDKLGIKNFEIRQKKDILKPFDGLILPGGESTAQLKLLHDLELFEPLKEKIQNGLPTLGICAGMILLCEHFQTISAKVKRNAYGRQLGSFFCTAEFNGEPIPMSFIRAPLIIDIGKATPLAQVNSDIVAAQENNQLICAFHPELHTDVVHKYFAAFIGEKNAK